MEDLSSLFQKISVGPSDVTPDVPTASPEDPINDLTLDGLNEILAATYVEPNIKYDWTRFEHDSHIQNLSSNDRTKIIVVGSKVYVGWKENSSHIYDFDDSADVEDFMEDLWYVHPEVDTEQTRPVPTADGIVHLSLDDVRWGNPHEYNIYTVLSLMLKDVADVTSSNKQNEH